MSDPSQLLTRDPYIPIDPFVKPGLIKKLVPDGAIFRCTFDVVLG